MQYAVSFSAHEVILPCVKFQRNCKPNFFNLNPMGAEKRPIFDWKCIWVIIGQMRIAGRWITFNAISYMKYVLSFFVFSVVKTDELSRFERRDCNNVVQKLYHSNIDNCVYFVERESFISYLTINLLKCIQGNDLTNTGLCSFIISDDGICCFVGNNNNFVRQRFSPF